MATLLLRNADVVVTMDATRREILDGGIFARDGVIEQVDETRLLPEAADEVVDLRGHVLLPGLVNTHHHFYQTLTRVVPAAQDAGLFDWLRTLYPIWARLTPDHVEVATTLALAELALTGCTTAFDHQYLFPNGSSVDDQVRGAEPVGIRVHLSRGSMSLGESDGGLPPDSVVESERAILEDTARMVAAHHEPGHGAMIQIAAAPCSPFSVTADLMAQAAAQARELGIRLHTHLAETADEESFCLESFGKRPLEYVADLGWTGDDVWFAHAVFMDDDEIRTMAETRTGVAHCPTSNMRLASGIPPIASYLDAGVPVGLGVDGSASNDASHMLAEARQALLLARLGAAPPNGDGMLMPARTALEMATRGGAEVLGRSDIGSLEAGKCADVIAIDAGVPGFAGAIHDLVAALVLCAPQGVHHSWVQGRRVVVDGGLPHLDLDALIHRHQVAARVLVEG